MSLVQELEITDDRFAFDGCHKIYIIEDADDEAQFLEYGYDIHPIEDLDKAWEDSCSLRFISNAKLNVSYIEQGARPKYDL